MRVTSTMSVPPPEGGRQAQQASPPRGRRLSDEDVHVNVLVRTIEHEIIPRLMLAHRADPLCLHIPQPDGSVTEADVEMFTRLVLAPDPDLAEACVTAMRQRGVSAEGICLGLLAPVARRLGELWEADLCDFTDVTFGLGRLHHMLHDLGPSFEQKEDSPANGYRVLLLPAPDEQHTFGLLMVAEFFRHEGWQVDVGLAEGGTDVVAAVRAEWFDVVGFSLGVEAHLVSLAERIVAVRRASANPHLCIMVGGSLLLRHPDLAGRVGADMGARDGREAPVQAERLVTSRGSRQVQ